MIVLCTWVPFLAANTAWAQFPQNEADPEVCDSRDAGFRTSSVKVVILLVVTSTHIYNILLIFIENRNIRNEVIREHSQLLLLRLVGLFILLAVVVYHLKTGQVFQGWEEVESCLGDMSAGFLIGDFLVVSCLPHRKQFISSFQQGFKIPENFKRSLFYILTTFLSKQS